MMFKGKDTLPQLRTFNVYDMFNENGTMEEFLSYSQNMLEHYDRLFYKLTGYDQLKMEKLNQLIVKGKSAINRIIHFKQRTIENVGELYQVVGPIGWHLWEETLAQAEPFIQRLKQMNSNVLKVFRKFEDMRQNMDLYNQSNGMLEEFSVCEQSLNELVDLHREFSTGSEQYQSYLMNRIDIAFHKLENTLKQFENKYLLRKTIHLKCDDTYLEDYSRTIFEKAQNIRMSVSEALIERNENQSYNHKNIIKLLENWNNFTTIFEQFKNEYLIYRYKIIVSGDSKELSANYTHLCSLCMNMNRYIMNIENYLPRSITTAKYVTKRSLNDTDDELQIFVDYLKSLNWINILIINIIIFALFKIIGKLFYVESPEIKSWKEKPLTSTTIYEHFNYTFKIGLIIMFIVIILSIIYYFLRICHKVSEVDSQSLKLKIKNGKELNKRIAVKNN